MAKTSTQLQTEEMTVKATSVGPRKSTVDLIKQIARAYTYSRLMPQGLGTFVAN